MRLAVRAGDDLELARQRVVEGEDDRRLACRHVHLVRHEVEDRHGVVTLCVEVVEVVAEQIRLAIQVATGFLRLEPMVHQDHDGACLVRLEFLEVGLADHGARLGSGRFDGGGGRGRFAAAAIGGGHDGHRAERQEEGCGSA